jgi:hypothetical protein
MGWQWSLIVLCCCLAGAPTQMGAVASLFPRPAETEGQSETESGSSQNLTEATYTSSAIRPGRRQLRVLATLCRPGALEANLLGPWGSGSLSRAPFNISSIDELAHRNGCGSPLRC